MKKMKHYVVTWEIDVEASSPLAAAREARRCQMPGTEALMFGVRRKYGRKVEQVDLLAQEPSDT